MSRRKSLRRTPGRVSAILGAFKDIRFDFVLGVIIVILYVSATMALSLEKVAVLLLGPIIAELALLGLDVYIVGWVRKALPIRALIAAGFGIAIGSAAILVNSSILIVGAGIIAASIMLIVYSLWRYRTTKELGVKTADPLSTINIILFMTALLVYVLGFVEVFVVMFACSLVILVHASLPFSIFLTMLAGGVVYSIYGNPNYALLVILAELLAQIYFRRAELIGRIKKASPLRTLITSVFGAIIGSTLAIVNQSALVLGVIVMMLSLLLFTYGACKFWATHDLGIRSQDPIITVGFIVALTSVLTLLLQAFVVFAVLFFCCGAIFYYRKLILEIPLVLVGAYLVQGVFVALIYPVIIVVVGVVMAAIGIVLKRVEAQRAVAAARTKSVLMKGKK